MTKVLLLTPLLQHNAWEDDINTKWPPLGLLYIASSLEKAGHQCKLVERRRIIKEHPRSPANLKTTDDQMMAEIKAFAPDVIAVSAMTFHIMDAYRACKRIKEELPQVEIVIGGSHPTAVPERTLKECPAIDYVVKGEGEEVMLEFCDGTTPREKIEGLYFRREGAPDGIHFTGIREVVDNITSLPWPALHLVDREFYFAPSSQLFRGYYLRGTTMFTSRGCPFKCAFCQSPQISVSNSGKFVRSRDAQEVVAEVKHLIATYGVEGIYFSDDVFTVHRARVEELCKAFIESGINQKIVWCCNVRVDLVDDKLLSLMKTAGCVKMLFGIESGSDDSLVRLNKGGQANARRNIETIKKVQAHGIGCETGIILGLPDDTEEDILATMRMLEECKPARVNRGKLYPIPGTQYYNELLAKGKVDPNIPWDQIYTHYTRSDFTFAAMPAHKFRKLAAKFDRRVTMPTNYKFMIKSNWKRHPNVAIRQFFLMIAHVTVLYFPIGFQDWLRATVEKFRFKSKYVFE